MADPDLRIRGWGGGGAVIQNPRGPVSKKNSFGPHFGQKRSPPPGGLSPGSATVITQCTRTQPKSWHTPYVYTGVGGQFMYDKGTSMREHKLPVSRSVSAEKRDKS